MGLFLHAMHVPSAADAASTLVGAGTVPLSAILDCQQVFEFSNTWIAVCLVQL
jgi:hypothetical protein